MSDAIARLNAALEGRYVIERELGEGGMATVYLVEFLTSWWWAIVRPPSRSPWLSVSGNGIREADVQTPHATGSNRARWGGSSRTVPRTRR